MRAWRNFLPMIASIPPCTRAKPRHAAGGNACLCVGWRRGTALFPGSDGKYQIPGSTVRGMVRENMQILGYGLVRPGGGFGRLSDLFP